MNEKLIKKIFFNQINYKKVKISNKINFKKIKLKSKFFHFQKQGF